MGINPTQGRKGRDAISDFTFPSILASLRLCVELFPCQAKKPLLGTA
jgi:hypothetical protein